MKNYKVVGKSVERTDARVKVTGSARYAGDLVAPGMLHGKILRSPVAHAKILNIDTGKARALPGVMAVITGKDFPGIPFGTRPDIRDQIPMPITKVHHFGEGVAAVAAVDEDTAETALDLIEVDYEELPVVLTSRDALAPGAPLVNEFKKSNIAYFTDFAFGDVEKGFKEAEYIREETSTPSASRSVLSSRTPASPKSMPPAGCCCKAQNRAPISPGGTCAGPWTSLFQR